MSNLLNHIRKLNNDLDKFNPLSMMRLIIFAFLLLSLSFFFTVDGYPSDGVTIATDKVQYKTGDEVILKIKNEMKEPIYFLGMCSLKECTKQNDQWICEDDECDAQQDVLVTGEEKDFHIRVVGLVVGDMKYKFDYRTAILERDQTTYSNDFFMISTGRTAPRLVDKQIKKVPVEKVKKEEILSPASDEDIEDEKTEKRNRYVIKNPNSHDRREERNNNQLKKYEKQGNSKSKSYGLKNNELVLAISGINKKELKGLDKSIQQKLSSVRSIEKIGFQKDVVQYFVTLKVSAEEFSDTLEKTEFPNFRIIPTKITSNYIDCALKHK